MPLINVGSDFGFSQIDFAQTYLDVQAKSAKDKEKRERENKELIASGVLSALDLEAPNYAIEQFNRAASLLMAQKSKKAIQYLQGRSRPIPDSSSHTSISDLPISIKVTAFAQRVSLKPRRSWMTSLRGHF